MNLSTFYKVSVKDDASVSEVQKILYEILKELACDDFDTSRFVCSVTDSLYENIAQKNIPISLKSSFENLALVVELEDTKEKNTFKIHHNKIIDKSILESMQSKVLLLSKSTLLSELDSKKDLEKLLREKLEELNEDLFNSAYYDSLTKLPNRAYFFDRLEDIISMHNRNKKLFGLMYIDLDGFKIINDSAGHDAGDTVLKSVASRMREVLRKHDIVARLGGDEFAIVVKECEHLEQLGLIARKIIKAIEIPVAIQDNKRVELSASIGITIFPKDGKNREELVKHADMSMYEVKNSGKGNFIFYNDKIEKSFLQEKQLNDDLKNSLKNDEFFLVYQPKIEIKTQKITGVEALLRWRHPTRGVLPNFEWIEAMENSNYSFEITKWVLLKAIKEITKLNIKLNKNLFVSVNFSIKEFLCDDFIEILSALNHYEREHLTIEILERKAIEHFEDMKDKLTIINKLGIDISFDDFGTGNTSLVYLTQVTPQELKIDRSFVSNIQTSKNYHIVKAIIAMAEGMEMKVIAEGAETKEEVDTLEELGCKHVQGYYYSKPILLDELEKFTQLH
jgi:two-component system CheB/CheR fusion protein